MKLSGAVINSYIIYQSYIITYILLYTTMKITFTVHYEKKHCLFLYFTTYYISIKKKINIEIYTTIVDISIISLIK